MEIIEAGSVPDSFTVFERAVDRMEGIEAIPAVAQRLLSLTSSPDASFADIEQLIASDPALTTRVLRVAASVLYGGRAAPTLQAALVRLGLREVRNVALTATVTAKASDAFHANLWGHGLATAILAEGLAKRLGKHRFAEPFVCGLLHELGTLVMAKVGGTAYQRLIGDADPERQVALEQKVYGFSHADIGALAVERWHLFDGLLQVIQFHHDPLAADALDFPAAVLGTIHLTALAAAVARTPLEALTAPTIGELLTRLGTDAAVVTEEWDRVAEQLQEYAALLR